eukprot:jgi/Bigna1/138080/aug1.42_g12788
MIFSRAPTLSDGVVAAEITGSIIHGKGERVNPRLLSHIERLGVTKTGKRRQRNQHHKWMQDAGKGGSRRRVSPAIKKLFDSSCKLIAVANSEDAFPKGREYVPEVAFAGRSNVGKSSLLKALSVKSSYVPTDDRPGTTRSIDFYEIGRLLRVVDLPGYGACVMRLFCVILQQQRMAEGNDGDSDDDDDDDDDDDIR